MSFSPNVSNYKPVFVRPEILTHANIPKPLHGLAPREIKGRYWWDKTRKAAYAENNHCCWACGIPKGQGKFNRQYLEAHENYSINYSEGFMEVTEITALCHTCHSFIHSGRLQALTMRQEIPLDKTKHILLRGFKILSGAGLEPFYGTALLYAKLFDNQSYGKAEYLKDKQIHMDIQQDWTKWHLLLEGEKHYSKFTCFEDWEKFYANK